MTEPTEEESIDEQSQPRRKRDREATERQLLEVALQLMKRDGVLAGLNLANVADEAGVNRGQIYQYFGTRQKLLRAAIEKSAWKATVQKVGKSLPFVERRLAVLNSSLEDSERFKLMALMVLDGDTSIKVFSNLEQTRIDLANDQATGALHPERDALMCHFVSVMIYMGYGIFRERMSLESGVPLDELDMRTVAIVTDILNHFGKTPPVGMEDTGSARTAENGPGANEAEAKS